MNDFSLFGPALIGLIAIGWWFNDLETMSELAISQRQRWTRLGVRLVMFVLAIVVLGNAGDLRQGSSRETPEGAEPDIPYSF